MQTLISLRIDKKGCIKKRILVGGPSPTCRPPFEIGEVNIFIEGDSSFILDTFKFLLKKLKNGTVIR